jgi:hypothetical protein
MALATSSVASVQSLDELLTALVVGDQAILVLALHLRGPCLVALQDAPVWPSASTTSEMEIVTPERSAHWKPAAFSASREAAT